MKFDAPRILFFLWLLLPVAGILIYGMAKQKNILRSIASADMLSFLAPAGQKKRPVVRMVLILSALALGVVALAQPKSGFHLEKVSLQGVDIMIALDCSRSMLAQDVKPDRLERAKREILDLIALMKADRKKTDRAGLVAFAGNAFLQCPLTLDYNGFGIFLRSLSPDFLPLGGTNIKAALETCLSAFDSSSDTDKAIILITDGENTAGTLGPIVEKLSRQNIRVFSVGVGSVHGAPVPKASGGFVKDTKGSIVMSKVDETTLKHICEATNGYYVRSVAGNMDLDEIYTRRISSQMNQGQFEQGQKKVGIARFQWLLLPCVLLLLMECLLGCWNGFSGKSQRRYLQRLLVIFLWTGVAVWAICPDTGFAQNLVEKGIQAFDAREFGEAKEYFMEAQSGKPDDPRLSYNVGAAAYKNKEYDLALKNFQKAAKSSDTKLQHLAKYNMGNALVQKGELEKAKQILEDVVKSFPDDEQAKDNLAWVEKKLKEKKQQQKNQNQKNQDQKNQDQQEQGQRNPNQKNQGQKNQDDKNSNQKNQADRGQGKKNQNQDESSTPQKQTQEQPQEQQTQGRQAEGQPMNLDQNAEPDKQRGQEGEKAVMDAKLNRLQDKPGFALVPPAGGEKPSKDW